MAFTRRVVQLLEQAKTLLQQILDDSGAQSTAISIETADFDEGPAISLPSIPANATRAIVVVVADENSANPARVAMFSEVSGTPPTDTVGLPLGDNDPYEIRGATNLANFRIVGVEAGIIQRIKVQYFT